MELMPMLKRSLICVLALSGAARAQDWPQHSMDRPAPRVVAGNFSGALVAPPADAIVLFDGKSLDGWNTGGRTPQPAKWKVEKGYMEVVKGTGAIQTTRGFGDVQLHVEFSTAVGLPDSIVSQERSNSGVFLMRTYEVQVLDSYNNKTYADGSAGAIYGQYPPLVNASRKPGEWQAYDIVFRAPRFKSDSTLADSARITVFHNGVLVQNNVAILGPTTHMVRTPYRYHADKLPLQLQDHGDPVRYRNIWVRELQ
jgi:hypothetical protein